MTTIKRFRSSIALVVAEGMLLLGCATREGETRTIETSEIPIVGSTSPSLIDVNNDLKRSESTASVSQITEPITPSSGATTSLPTKAKPSTTLPDNHSTDAPSETPSQSVPASDTPDEPEREYGSGFPEKCPFAFVGWEEVHYMPQNTVQAGLYGLEPNQVRSWVFFNQPGEDLVEEHRKIASAITLAGGRIGVDGLAKLPSDGAGKITGRWQGFTFVVVATFWKFITISLLDR